MKPGQPGEGSPESGSHWLVCHICSPCLWAPRVFRRVSVKLAVELGESSSEKQDVRTHTHTHTDSALKHGDCLRGDTVCRNQTPQPPKGLVITSLVKVSLVRRGSSSAELTLKEGPRRGVGSAEFASRHRVSCPWQFLGPGPESLMSRWHEEQTPWGLSEVPTRGFGNLPRPPPRAGVTQSDSQQCPERSRSEKYWSSPLCTKKKRKRDLGSVRQQQGGDGTQGRWSEGERVGRWPLAS